MLPFLVVAGLAFGLQVAGVTSWHVCLRWGLAGMFLLTASAHWGKRRPDLIRMVPAAFSRPDRIVTVTGVLELAGAVGLLIPFTAPFAAAGLALLLVAIFPANIHAAREKMTIGGRPVTKLPLRTLLQIVFIGALIVAGFYRG